MCSNFTYCFKFGAAVKKIIFVGVFILAFVVGMIFVLNPSHTPLRTMKSSILPKTPVDVASIISQNDNGISLLDNLKIRAHSGDPIAQYELGLVYFKGKEINLNLKLAAQWFEKAAKQGNSTAQFLLANMYFEGKEFPQDEQLGIYWLKKSAKQGYIDAQHVLGEMYYKGQGVPENDQSAKTWLLKAALKNHNLAQYTLAGIYLDEKNFTQAHIWLEKSALQENNLSLTLLGELTRDGHGVPKNLGVAHKWFTIAANKDYKRAIEKRSEIEHEMNFDQLEESKRLVQKWKNNN